MRLALLGLAALVWIAVPVSARAEGETVDTWDGKTIADGFAAGDGTQDNPFQIETAAQLAYFAKAVNEGNWYDGEYIILKNNIDLNNQEWTPIGIYRSSFRGNFDGRNHTVMGMLISNSSADYVGLFGECTRHNINSAIKNITVKDSTIQGKRFVGAIVGRAVEINIENCRSIANTINSEKNVGGICGYFGGYSGGKVSQCYNSSEVRGKMSAGGIAGSGDRCTAENCLNTGEITVTTTQYTSTGGGIFGSFSDIIASATITACVNLGKVSGGESFGGIVGSTDSGSTGHISNCYYNMDAITGGFDAGTALTAGQLCGALPDGLDSAIWEVGSVDISTAKATQGRFGKATGTYINLQSVAAIEKVTTDSAEVYNFATTGNDAEWDTYTLITTAKEFAAIGQDTANCNENYVLKNNIDVSGVELRSIGNPETPYTGKFSGDGHTISHVNMAGDCLGLFGGIGNINGQIAESGKVMLLAANGVIASNNEAGGICGYLRNGEIYGCSFIGTVKGGTAGGICSQSGVYNKISQCFFAGDVQGEYYAAGICGYSGTIDHCISIGNVKGNVKGNGELAGISNSGDPDSENCHFNNDICNVKDEYNLGCSTLKLTSSSFFEELKTNGFNTELWTKKANDKETGIAYYPSLGENNAVGVNYTTGLSFERADTNTPTYGENITFNVKALVNFVTDGQPISAEDTDGSFVIRIGNETVVNAADFQDDGTATYNARTAGETTFTLVYKGNDNSFFSEKTKNLIVDIAPAKLTAEGDGIARGAYGNKLSELTVTGLTAKLGTEIIDGTWRIDGDKVPYVGDSETYMATFIPKEHPEYYQTLTAQVRLEISKAIAPKIRDLDLKYSWAAKGEKAVQIPGLPEDLGKTVMTVITREDSENILAADSEVEYSEGKLIFTLGENAVEDIGKTATLLVELQSQNYENFRVGVHILRTAKADREDTPDPDAFDMTFTVSGNDLAAEITTDRTDVEFSFDGTDFGQTKTMKAGHDEKVTAQIRYEESDDYNASPAISKTWNSGHGTLTHHDRVEPTCQAEGSIEYWTCDVCGLYFASADGSKSITAAETVLPKTEHSWSEDYQSDMTGHWHKCSSCGATTNPERHVSGGPATTQQAEICTVCGYEIAPKRPADNNTNSGQDNNNGNNNSNSNTVSGNNAGGNSNSNTGSPDNASDNDDNDDPSDNNSHATPTPTLAPLTSTATPKPAPKPTATPAVTVAPATTPAPAPTEESTGGDSAAATEETVVMEDQTQNADTPETGAASSEALEETSAKGMTPGRVAAAAAAGAVVVGGGGAAVYVTMIKGKFKFK